jgi:hyperosmotically inducible periplasmic protein
MLWHKICLSLIGRTCLRRWNMIRRARNLDVVLCLLCAAMVAGCPGDRMSQSTTEAIDDSLIANRVTLALYSDKEVHGRGMRVESVQGVVELTGVVASTAEAQRAEQIAQQVKGVKAVHNRLKVQEGRRDPAPRTSSSTGKTRQ